MCCLLAQQTFASISGPAEVSKRPDHWQRDPIHFYSPVAPFWVFTMLVREASHRGIPFLHVGACCNMSCQLVSTTILSPLFSSVNNAAHCLLFIKKCCFVFESCHLCVIARTIMNGGKVTAARKVRLQRDYNLPWAHRWACGFSDLFNCLISKPHKNSIVIPTPLQITMKFNSDLRWLSVFSLKQETSD